MMMLGVSVDRLVWRSLLVSILFLGFGCRDDRDSQSDRGPGSPMVFGDHVSAIQDVLSIDGELGADRNHASESMSLAAAVRNYVTAIDSVDFSRCPDDFRAAFLAHRDAWAASVPFFERFPDLRGEMHTLFEEIRSSGARTGAELEQVEAPIWDTWAEVEAVAADYGAMEPPGGD